MYKLPKVNLKWDSLYVYHLRSFKHLCGLFLSTDLRIEWVLRWQIWRRYLSMHHDTSIEGWKPDNRMIFLAANRSPHFFCLNNQRIFVLQFYICMVLTRVEFSIYRNKPATLQVLDHVKMITTEFTLVIIGI